MQIQFTYTGQLAMITGVSAETVEVADGAGVVEAVLAAAKGYPAKFSELLLGEDGKIRDSVLVMVDGEQVDAPNEHALTDGADVFILTPMAGG